MPHRPRRKETICLNCGAEVTGKYCPDCGQENAEPKESIWHLLQHFFSDLTHFDGKLWHTAKYLILKPGFLSREYTQGRRVRYVNPVNLYFFTSALFFLIFSSLFNPGELSSDKRTSQEKINKSDSIVSRKMENSEDTGINTVTGQYKLVIDSFKTRNSGFGFIKKYKSREEYDSLLKSGKKDHNWIERQFMYKFFELNDRFKDNSQALGKAVMEKFLHSLPKMLFILLPLFALVLKLIYIRRPQFFYVDHIIFTIHFYVFTFISMMVIFGINKLNSFLSWSALTFLSAIISLSIFFYFYKALRNFYQQSRAKTILKFILLLLLYIVIFLIFFILFMLFSIMQV